MISNVSIKGKPSMGRRTFLKASLALSAASSLPSGMLNASLSPSLIGEDREYWVQVVKRVANPVLQALSERRLKAKMPVEAPHENIEVARGCAHLEAMGRLLAGMAPWLENGSAEGEEGVLRSKYCEWARMGIDAGTDPASPDLMNFNRGTQPLVDTAYLALVIIRAPTELWNKLDKKTQNNLIHSLKDTRQILPHSSNWLLFSATVETGLCMMGEQWDSMRVDYALRQFEAWYKGDGVYGDGPDFHWDYYNSFVIHPMLLNVMDAISKVSQKWDSFRPNIFIRAQRYAAIQERMISPEGTFPPIGRSLAYRFGAFQLLAEMALRRQLPENVSPAQVRCALTIVMRRMVEAPGTFDRDGWLTVGFCGHQPSIAESYIDTGSCYLCSAAWLPLGLPTSDPFWAGAKRPWTAKKAWSGEKVDTDHAID